MGKVPKDLRILIVDDDESSLKLLEVKLQAIGYGEHIIKASNGKEAITLAQTEQPDIIFLDLMMPQMDGGNVKRRLLDKEATKDIPIIFSTGLVTMEEAEERDGVVGGGLYIAKPYNDEEKIGQAITAALKDRLE
ncbi:MAG: response regulator [Candidatus Omnitrophica bacterium]|nr:response regulator [Candidatus Omnitrophota bacterium]